MKLAHTFAVAAGLALAACGGSGDALRRGIRSDAQLLSVHVTPGAGRGAAFAARPQATAVAGETYYLTIFGFEGGGPLNLAGKSHTFGLFVKADGGDLRVAPLAAFVISWLPTDDVVAFGQGIKPGRNFSLAETLGIAAANGYPVQRSGLYRIDRRLYQAALARKQLLDRGATTGQILYKMIDDFGGRQAVLAGVPGGYTNCIHALSDALRDSAGGLLDTGLHHGYRASDDVFQFFWGLVADRTRVYDQALAPRLGL